MLDLTVIENFEKEYEVRIISISRGLNGFEILLGEDFGKLPVAETTKVPTGGENYPFAVRTVINGIEFTYMIAKEDC